MMCERSLSDRRIGGGVQGRVCTPQHYSRRTGARSTMGKVPSRDMGVRSAGSVVEGRVGTQLGASEIPWNPSNKFGWCLLSAGAGGNLHCKRRAPTGPVYGGTEAGLNV
jgi:hypothetical protein